MHELKSYLVFRFNPRLKFWYEGKDGLRRMAILGHSSVMEHKCLSSGSRARVSGSVKMLW